MAKDLLLCSKQWQKTCYLVVDNTKRLVSHILKPTKTDGTQFHSSQSSMVLLMTMFISSLSYKDLLYVFQPGTTFVLVLFQWLLTPEYCLLLRSPYIHSLCIFISDSNIKDLDVCISCQKWQFT